MADNLSGQIWSYIEGLINGLPFINGIAPTISAFLSRTHSLGVNDLNNALQMIIQEAQNKGEKAVNQLLDRINSLSARFTTSPLVDSVIQKTIKTLNNKVSSLRSDIAELGVKSVEASNATNRAIDSFDSNGSFNNQKTIAESKNNLNNTLQGIQKEVSNIEKRF